MRNEIERLYWHSASGNLTLIAGAHCQHSRVRLKYHW